VQYESILFSNYCYFLSFVMISILINFILVSRRRETNRKKAAQLLREGKRAEARDCLARCIDITPQMALELMNVRAK
jgi:hypothetical protein